MSTNSANWCASGDLDFALLKPIDTQFLDFAGEIRLVGSCEFPVCGRIVGAWAWCTSDYRPTLAVVLLYPLYIACGVAILYSLTIVLAATTVWLGRNQSIYEFWFYITNFSRYPLEIYNGPLGTPLRMAFTFLIPVLIVVNVPARFLAMPLTGADWLLAVFAVARDRGRASPAAAGCSTVRSIATAARVVEGRIGSIGLANPGQGQRGVRQAKRRRWPSLGLERKRRFSFRLFRGPSAAATMTPSRPSSAQPDDHETCLQFQRLYQFLDRRDDRSHRGGRL